MRYSSYIRLELPVSAAIRPLIAEYLPSLGAPKAIFHTNGMWGTAKNVTVLGRNYWPRGIVYDGWIGKTNLNPCPPQWLGGLHAMIVCPVVYNSPCIMMPLGEGTLTPDLFMKVTKMNKVEGLRAPPQTIVTLYENPETNALLKSLEFVGYLGAPLDQAIGDDLCQHTRLCSFIGSTETGDQVSIRPLDRKLWYTHEFVPENGHKMIPLDPELGGGPDGLHELVLFNTEDGRPSPFQLAFWNSGHRHLKCVETKELYTPVKDIDGRVRWAFSSRAG
jgi:acyl-coenzyme A synthetase/AMP-(fatty) acid ligase